MGGVRNAPADEAAEAAGDSPTFAQLVQPFRLAMYVGQGL